MYDSVVEGYFADMQENFTVCVFNQRSKAQILKVQLQAANFSEIL
jgi:hypothetical protein